MSRIPAVALAIFLGCAPPPQPGDSISASSGAASADLVGVVRVVGSAPVNVQTVLETEDGTEVRLAGPLEAELRRLSGAEVSVRGESTSATDPMVDRQVEVTSYEIVAIDGMAAIVGEIVAKTGDEVRLRTSAGDEVLLEGAPPSFQVGQKVWVQGPTRVTVQAYGTLTP